MTLRVTARCQNDAEGEALVLPILSEIRSLLGDLVYSDCGEELKEVCHKALLANGQTLSVAESCTGGLLASAFVDQSGSSGYFTEGAITYSNEAKMRRLGVSEKTLREHGAVSEACAREMAEGIRRAAQTDFALSTTGIAGPDGGTPEKPVGLVYVALATKETTLVKELQLWGDRARIRHLTVLHALDLLRKYLCTK